MKHAVWTLATCLALTLYTDTSLQAHGPLDDSTIVTVVVPASALKGEGYLGIAITIGHTRQPIYGEATMWPGHHPPIFGVELVRAVDGQPMLKDKADWRSRELPIMLEMTLEKIGKKDGLIEFEYRSAAAVIKFRVAPVGSDSSRDPKPEEMLRPFVIAGASTGKDAQAYLTQSYRLIASRVFTGALAGVPEADQLVLMALSHITAKGTALAAESYKGNTYFAVDLSGDGVVYNALKLNEGQRLSRVTNELLLSVIKAFAVPLRTSSTIYGVKLHTLIEHMEFLQRNANPGKDDISVYAAADLIRKFADADITSQEFIDGCVVIVNGNRVKVVLTGMLPAILGRTQ